jgi:surface protein
MSVIGGQNPIVQDGLVYILDFGNERSYTSGSNTAQSLIYNPVTASFVAPPAGDYSGLAAAYSVRRVVSSYSGPAMEVQSGSVSASIGFDSLGNLDTASLEAFAGSGDAFVKTWYDQSGNGYHASQVTASNQPQVVSGGSVVLENNKPALEFEGATVGLNLTQITPNTNWTMFGIGARKASLAIMTFLGSSNGSINSTMAGGSVDNKAYLNNGTQYRQTTATYTTTSQTLWTGIVLNSLPHSIYLNSSLQNSTTVNATITQGFTHIGRYNNLYSNATLTEILLYQSDQSSNRTYIEENINSYYNIFTSSFDPTPDFDSDKVEFEPGTSLDTNQSFPGFSYDQGNLTLIFTGETKAASTLFSQDGTVSIISNTSSIGYGSPTNNLGRTFPASGFDHVSLRFTTGSVDCFVNGIPTAPNSIFPTGSTVGGGKLTIPNYSGSLGNLLVYNRELSDDEIYAIYSQQARRYGLIEQDKPYTVDSSVYAYTQAAGITGSSVITALDAFVVGLKANNLWNKMIAIYPFLGSDTVKTRYNLKDPSLNTTAITYSGSWSASDSGSYSNNTSSYGILENIKGDYYHPLISSQSIHLSYLSYDTPVSGGYLMGTEELPGLPGDIAQPAAAYSVRKVRTAYSGFCMDVRRDLDDTTGSIGFDAFGNLDTGSLLAFVTGSVGTGSGFVARWYDQSGNDRHATQSVAANQPLILSSGSIVTGSVNIPALYTGGSSWMSTNTTLTAGFTSDTTVAVSSFEQSDVLDRTLISNNINALNCVQINTGGTSTNRVSYGAEIAGSARNSTGVVMIQDKISLLFGTYGNNSSTLYLDSTTGIEAAKGTANVFTSGLFLFTRDAGGGQWIGRHSEILIYTSSQANNRQPIEQNINSYFNIYTPVGYNLNTNSLSLFSSPTTVAGAANAAASGLTTGGLLGLITVSRTGSSNYTLWKNRVPNKVTLSPSTASSSELYLNAANLNNSLFSASQNNIAYASVGAGLTDSETTTYYELVDTLQTNLGRVKSANPNTFITTWDTRISGTGTISNTSSIVLPLFGTQAITASWGDGTVSLISQSAQVDRTHSYAEPGIYTVSITGQGQGFRFANDGDRNKLMDVVQWGSISGSSDQVFTGCNNLSGTAPDSHILQTTSTSRYFGYTSKFNGYVNNWDTSKVTLMQGMFEYNTVFNQNIGSWDVSNVTSISGYWGFIFRNATSFNNGGSPSINNWNTSKMTSMGYVFSNARAFNQPIGGWNVASSTDFSYMFLNAVSFNNAGSPNINNWIFNTSSTFTMISMFQGASVFNQPIGNWNVSKSIDMSSMFRSATSFNQNIGSWNVSSVANMFFMFLSATSFNQNLGSWNVGNVTNTSGMFESAFSFNNSGSSTINNWNTSKINNMSGMFNSARVFNQPIGNWNVSSSTNMSRMFYSASVFNQDIGSWDISSSINMSEMFDMARDFNQNIGSWNTDNVTSMYRTFRLATSFSNGDLPDINNWNTSKVNNMQEMFNGATLFNQPIGNWDVSNVTNMYAMFQNAIAFNQDIGSWNVGNVTSFNGYFGGFMQGKSSANYSYLHTIYDGWINYKLQPNRTIDFSTINYSASAAEGKALLERTYNTASIIGSNEDAGQLAITCSVNHNVVAGNKIFISGSTNPGINGVQIVLSTGSATTLTLEGIPPAPLATDGEVITGYGWNITDGNPV